MVRRIIHKSSDGNGGHIKTVSLSVVITIVLALLALNVTLGIEVHRRGTIAETVRTVVKEEFTEREPFLSSKFATIDRNIKRNTDAIQRHEERIDQIMQGGN